MNRNYKENQWYEIVVIKIYKSQMCDVIIYMLLKTKSSNRSNNCYNFEEVIFNNVLNNVFRYLKQL